MDSAATWLCMRSQRRTAGCASGFNRLALAFIVSSESSFRSPIFAEHVSLLACLSVYRPQWYEHYGDKVSETVTAAREVVCEQFRRKYQIAHALSA